MKLYEISKQEFKDKLSDPRHAQVQAKLVILDQLLEHYGWTLEWTREPGDFLDYTLTMEAGMTQDQIKAREENHIYSAKIRIVVRNLFWEPGPASDWSVPDIVVREVDNTPTRVTMWIMHDEEADE